MTAQQQSVLDTDDTTTTSRNVLRALKKRSYYFLPGLEEEDRDGIRLCELYLSPQRTPFEDAELDILYRKVYSIAFSIVFRRARQAGLFDPDVLADTAVGLVDFCCKNYDPKVQGLPGRPLPFHSFLYGVARAYLRKHRDFLCFSRKMTQTGLSTGRDEDVLTAAWCGRASRDTSEETDDGFDVLDQAITHQDIDPLFAQEWEVANPAEIDEILEQSESGDQDVLDAHRDRMDANTTLRDWVLHTVEVIRQNELSPAVLADRAPAILGQLREATGARVTDIAKRLMTQVAHGCAIARALLQALLRTLQPQRHAQTIALIESALAEPEQPAAAEPSALEPVTVSEPVVLSTAGASHQEDDSNIGFLIDPADLFHGRVPPAKPRYVVVDTVPEELPGAPPLDEDAADPPGSSGSGKAVRCDGFPDRPARDTWVGTGRHAVLFPAAGCFGW